MMDWWKALPLPTRTYIVFVVLYVIGGLLTFGYAHEVAFADAYFLKGVKSMIAGIFWPLYLGKKLTLWLF